MRATTSFILTIMACLCFAVAAHAQQPAKPDTLPDLTPNTVVKPTYGYVAPKETLSPGESTMVSPEPEWANKKRKERKVSAEEIFAKLPLDVQDQILAETAEANANCNKYKTYAQFHNCECLATHFFEERVFSPEDHKDRIVGRISSECVSLPGAAGYGFSQCTVGMRYMLKPERSTEYCKCFANEFAKGYQLSPYPDYDNIRAVNRRTNSACLKKLSTPSSPIVGLP